MYIEHLAVHNIRCFDKVSFDFLVPGLAAMTGLPEPRVPNVNLLIGSNGTGKTTTFQAFALALLRPILAISGSGLPRLNHIRYGHEAAEITAKVWVSPVDRGERISSVNLMALGGNAVSTPLRKVGDFDTLVTPRTSRDPLRWQENLKNEQHPGVFLAGYGANRRTERPEVFVNRQQNSVRYQRVSSLFEADYGVIPLSLAYAQCLQHERWEEVTNIVNHLLEGTGERKRREVRLTNKLDIRSEPIFNFDGIPLTLRDLSDGYRLFVGWVIDLLTHLAQVLPKEIGLRDAYGIVIVDEVDLFLAPSWQRVVVEELSAMFPNIQWLCSTHSPLVAGSLDNENIYILKRRAPFTSQAVRPSSVFEGKSTDEVLVELFGVEQPRSPELQRQLGDLGERAMRGDMEAAFLYLQRLNRGTGDGGERQ
jgi:predicted ATP-binding protein involved in virulence